METVLLTSISRVASERVSNSPKSVPKGENKTQSDAELLQPEERRVKMQKWKSNSRSVVKWTVLLVVLVGGLQLSLAQSWTTRDPRFYSREGVHDYNPPSPGDPDYR